MVKTNLIQNNFTLFLAIVLVIIVTNITVLTGVIVTAKKSQTLKQIPSQATDYPSNDASVLQVRPFKAVQDSTGYYHIRGEVFNTSNKTLLHPKVSASLFDKNDALVGTAKPWFVSGLKLAPNSSGTFDLIVNPNELSGKPASYRLTFTYTTK